jgi:GT2 family glycosyltransferase
MTLLRAVSLTDVAKLRRRIVAPAATSGTPPAPEIPDPLRTEARAVAESFASPIELSHVRPIELADVKDPEVSIVIPVWNRWRFTYKCLAAIAENLKGSSYEVVVVDNASTDETREILDKVRNLRVVRNPTNLGFLGGSNAGVRAARGRYILFLNNDAHILSGTVPALLSTIRADKSVGAVGGRVIFLDGRLQEAGSIVFNDGACLGYGRGDDPFEPQYSYLRDVDFCSGALLLTPADLFADLGMFDERYAPAYYEDADYCMAVRANGRRVIYQPAAVIVHHEFGSSSRREDAIEAQARNRRVFVEKWASVLREHEPASHDNVLRGRDASRRTRLLFVDDRVPDPRLGCGYPRTYRMLTSLRELGWAVTFFPLLFPERLEPCTSDLQGLGVEVITGAGDRRLDLKEFLECRSDHYDVILISRPHNMKEALPFIREAAPRARIVYDAEAIFAMRELQLLALDGAPARADVADALVREEASLVRSADAVTAVSSQEAKTFRDFGVRQTHVVGHLVEPRPTRAAFADRSGLLFVGSLASRSPNEDAVLHFVREVLPLIRRELPCTLFVVGSNASPRISSLESAGVRIMGMVDDLGPWYARVRGFVIPTRYAAGIPLKLYEASAFGLPSVATPLVAGQVGWRDGSELLVGETAEKFARQVVRLHTDGALWNRVRAGAISAVRRDCSREAFVAALSAATGVSGPIPQLRLIDSVEVSGAPDFVAR